MIGTLTIGQAPRPDITPILERHLPPQAKVLHSGVLDGLSREDISARFAPRPGMPELITRLLDGTSVQLDKEAVRDALALKLADLEDRGCDLILLLCTGHFTGLTLKRAWLLEPDHIVPPAIAAMMGTRQLGVMVPLASQAVSESDKFSVLQRKPIFGVASPYASETNDLVEAAQDLRMRGAQAILLDCMGFTEQHRTVAAEASRIPVFLSNAMIAKLVSEMTS